MSCSNTSIDGFHLKNENGEANTIVNPSIFNGYTNYWQNSYNHQYRYANLLKVNIPDVAKTIIQTKIDMAEALGMNGLQMQEGFFNGLISAPYTVLENPSPDELRKTLGESSAILVFADRTSETGKKLQNKNKPAINDLNSYQKKAEDYSVVEAFILQNGQKTLYVVLGDKQEQFAQLKSLITNTEQVLKTYDMKRGWFGVETLLKSVTCTPGNPLDVIGIGMNEGNSWFVFNGYMEFLAKEEIDNWVKAAGIPVVTDVGYSPVFGCDDWDGLQVQSMFESDSWLQFARAKNGYLFRNYGNMGGRGEGGGGARGSGSGSRGSGSGFEEMDFDGYFASAGNAGQINRESKPFVNHTGALLGGAVNHMILFNKKGDVFNRAKMWEAIMSRRAVAVGENALIIGSDKYRQAMQFLLLDRVYIEDYFGDRLNINAVMDRHQLLVTVCNWRPHAISGTLSLQLPAQLSVEGSTNLSLHLPANSSKELVFEINPAADAMEKYNAVGVRFDWDQSSKATLASMYLPPAVSVHQLLYGASSGFQFPVTIHNITKEKEVTVKLTMTEQDNPDKVVFTEEQTIQVAKGDYKTLNFRIKQNPGNYSVKTGAMGVTASTQLGIDGNTGTVALKEVDLNQDGVNEYQMENDLVRVTLLTTGARVIEYVVKERNDNVFFKLWPEKSGDDDRPFRERGYYPYGGFEDFLGQASVETHKVYKAEVLKREGDYTQVRMVADYYGNQIEKIFTLYGNTPLLEVRFALRMINPEMNVLGPQPILELGKAHGVEDVFVTPELDGLQKNIMKPEQYYGRIMFLKEGWNAGYDTKEDVSFTGAFPVRRPYFLHMWMNHPSNTDARHYYVEFQPWLPLFQHTVSYFSYYMWATAGSWEKGVQALRDRNLITTP